MWNGDGIDYTAPVGYLLASGGCYLLFGVWAKGEDRDFLSVSELVLSEMGGKEDTLTMAKREEVVSIKEAREQVEVAINRLALMHLAFSRTILEELGEVKGKDLIIKSILEYGKRVGERTKQGRQDLPYYGLHDKYVYADKEYVDTRKKPISEDETWDLSLYRVYGCVLAKIFHEYGENDLGRLYCYVDPAKSMAVDPNRKLVHTACEPCGDDHCAFELLPTTVKERKDFMSKSKDWRNVDPILAKEKHTNNTQ